MYTKRLTDRRKALLTIAVQNEIKAYRKVVKDLQEAVSKCTVQRCAVCVSAQKVLDRNVDAINNLNFMLERI